MTNTKLFTIKALVFASLTAPLAFAAESTLATSAISEPVYLSICGIILIAFGTIKGKNS